MVASQLTHFFESMYLQRWKPPADEGTRVEKEVAVDESLINKLLVEGRK